MKTRIIQTRFWDDEFVSEATKHARYLYIYLLTSQYINLCGIFQLSDRKILFETGMTSNEFEIAKKELTENRKVLFKDGWIKIINASKNNKYTNSPLNEKPYNAELRRVPDSTMDFFNSSIDSTMYSTQNSKLKTKNSKPKEKEEEKEKFSYEDFVDIFNQIKNSRYGYADKKARGQFDTLVRAGVTEDLLKHAIINAKSDRYLIENPKYLTPEYITRVSQFEKWVNAKPFKKESDKKTTFDVL